MKLSRPFPVIVDALATVAVIWLFTHHHCRWLPGVIAVYFAIVIAYRLKNKIPRPFFFA